MTTLTFGGVRAALTTHRPHTPGLVARLAREWELWTARRSMANLGDEALHDIGVGRSEIDDAVRHGRRALRRG